MPPKSEQELLRREAFALRQAERLANQGYRLLDLARLERAGRGLVVDTESHQLWRHAPGEPANGRPLEHAFGITDGFELGWYEPAGVTIDEALERDRRTQAKAAEAAAEERQRVEARRKSPPKRTLTLGDEDRGIGAAPSASLPTGWRGQVGCLWSKRMAV